MPVKDRGIHEVERLKPVYMIMDPLDSTIIDEKTGGSYQNSLASASSEL
jgi:hypothetical protein